MPSTDLSTALREYCSYATPGGVLLETIELHHDDWAAPLRIVLDHADLAATLEASAPRDAGSAVLFARGSLEIGKAGVDDSGQAELELRLDDVDRSVSSLIAQADTGASPVEVIIRNYVSSDLTAPGLVEKMHVAETRIKTGMVVARCVYIDHVNRLHPRQRFTRSEFPGLAA